MDTHEMGAVGGECAFRGRIQEPQVYPAELRLRAKGALQLIPEICRRIALYKNMLGPLSPSFNTAVSCPFQEGINPAPPALP